MEKSIKSMASKYGLYLGLFYITIIVLIYVIDLEFMTKWYLNVLIFLVFLGFGIYSTVKAKNMGNGFITFKQAFSAYFITIAIGILLSTAFSIILFNFIDTDAAEIVQEKVIEVTTQMMENFGTPKAEMDKAISAMQEQNQFSVINQLKGIAWQLIIFSVIGLLVALGLKKTDPNVA